MLQDITQYEETQETLALLKVLALTNKQIEDGKLSPAKEIFARLRLRDVGAPKTGFGKCGGTDLPAG